MCPPNLFKMFFDYCSLYKLLLNDDYQMKQNNIGKVYRKTASPQNYFNKYAAIYFTEKVFGHSSFPVLIHYQRLPFSQNFLIFLKYVYICVTESVIIFLDNKNLEEYLAMAMKVIVLTFIPCFCNQTTILPRFSFF